MRARSLSVTMPVPCEEPVEIMVPSNAGLSISFTTMGIFAFLAGQMADEAKAYIEERKWGMKEANIDFRDIDPFDGEVKADEVPMAEGTAPKKRGRKPKKVA